MLNWSRLLRFARTKHKHVVNLVSRQKSVGSGSQAIVETVTRDRSHKEKSRQFVDFKRVSVKGGDGGNGCVSFLSLFANEFAGPDGGDAGNGGHVVFEADSNITSLTHVKSQYKAENGQNGRNKSRAGKNAEHVHIKVPIGTMFKDAEFRPLADLSRVGERFIGARGGGGGKGNKYFVSSTDTAPTAYEEGGRGQERALVLELKVIAHVGLVGFPNAGKSTLLRALSKARPKVAAYPFTTLRPHIGVIEYKDHEQVAVADIPGLIPGAHKNRGLGIAFLKHIERCVCLLYVLDLSSHDPLDQLESLKHELDQYAPGLSRRPHAIVANKLDLAEAQENLRSLRSGCEDMTVFALSAKCRTDIGPLVKLIRELYDEHHGGNKGR